MTHHDHRHSGSGKHTEMFDAGFSVRRLHKDWRVWLIVALMLTAIVIYVLTLDESVLPTVFQTK
jgi:hypothetical protein